MKIPSLASIFDNELLSTPAFIFDKNSIQQNIETLQATISKKECKILFSLKSCSEIDTLFLISPLIEGFSASSLFEAKLAREVLGAGKSVHITTPGLQSDEINELAGYCDYISFNSLSQWNRYKNRVDSKVSCGLRINPQLSHIKDERYDPCRKHSKLGVPLDQLIAAIDGDSGMLVGIDGLHFHTNCDSSDFAPLLKTVEHLDVQLESFLPRMKWINLGGGYLFNDPRSLDPFYDAVNLLKSKYDLEVFIEPGASIVREAGYMVSTVLDIFASDGKEIAILDTTVNHMPEVFEYQYEPDVLGHIDDGPHQYILAGCTCLAGDVFGEYAFDQPLEIGSRVVFANVGAYTLVKAHMFNGVNLPAIYAYTIEGKLELKKQFTYEDFKSRCGANNYATT